MVKKVTASSFEKLVLQTDQPVVVDVWASWCGPCRAMAPIFEEAAQKFAHEARFLKLDADENQEIMRQYKVLGLPTLLYFRHGRLIDRKMGMQNSEAIHKRLTPLLTLTPEQAEDKELTGLFRWPFRNPFKQS